VGNNTTLRRVKKKSKTSLKLKEEKLNKLKGRNRGKKKKDDGSDRKTGGCNGFGEDDGYDLPPDGEDEFDMNDLVGSVKKQKRKSNLLMDTKIASKLKPVSSSGGDEKRDEKQDEKWTSTVANDRRGVGVGVASNKADNNAPSSKKQNNNSNNSKGNTTHDGTLITAKTPTREIIAAFNNPKPKKQNETSSNGLTKQEKKKAFLKNKKLKKRKRGKGASDDDDDEEDYANQQALHALHSQSHSSSRQQTQAKTKQHVVKQQNHTHTMVARSVMDIQVERPPTFTTLPRGANKLAKNQKVKPSKTNEGNTLMEEDDNAKAKRIRKEQQALEAMRQKVMKQYAILRESRRSGGR